MKLKPRVFTVPPSAPFLATLARALLDGTLIPGYAPGSDPLALASATVYLPTRRAVRAFGDALLNALGTEATLLPRIVPLGEVDEDALAFADIAGLPERPSPVSPSARRLLLAQLVLKFADETTKSGQQLVAASPAAALQLADELARLFDDLTIAGIPFEALDTADFIPANLDEYWQKSLDFLKIARKGWDGYLAANALVDPVVWRDRLLAREAERLNAGGGGPVIAAGSTGTIPAVAELIATIAKRADGAVVLPGLDQALDDASFSAIEGGKSGGIEIEPSPGHPQFGLKRLIARIGIARSDVETIGTPANAARERLLSEAFRPAATTDLWRERSAGFDRIAGEALADVSLVEAKDPREEALAIAIALRETLEGTAEAALVTPDRALARRVAAELHRWEIAVDDSAGVALADSDAGRLARLVATAAAEALAPVPLLALLRHPLLLRSVKLRAIDALEVAILRGPRSPSGAEGLMSTLEDVRTLAQNDELHRRDPRMKLREADWDLARELVGKIGSALKPLLQLREAGDSDLATLLQAHRDALEALGAGLGAADDGRFDRTGRHALATAFDQLAAAARHVAKLSLADYNDAFNQLLAGEPPLRPPFKRGARIRILGPLEARLLECDRIILGGLNEGTWPPETRADAWLSRPMRRELNLDLPERRIGLAAHDFAQATGTREVLLTRARKENGVETVPSRFLQRIAAVAPKESWDEACTRGVRYIHLARELEQADAEPPISRPAPKPPAEVRPTRLSVTEIETLIRDPYSIYARHVLQLEPLDEIDADPSAADRGAILHDAFAGFAEAFPEQLPVHAFEALIERGNQAFDRVKVSPGVHAIWWPRFVRAAAWFIGEEAGRRPDVVRTIAEKGGRIVFDAGGRPFTLTARADRIDLRKDGSIALADYKSGQPPTLKQVLTGLAPQLPLEAAIILGGGFEDVPPNPEIAEISVIRVSGGHPPGEWVTLDVARATGKLRERAQTLGITDPGRLAAVSRELLEALIRTFAAAETPYLSIPRPKWRGRFGEYDHLARVKEWSANEEGTE